MTVGFTMADAGDVLRRRGLDINGRVQKLFTAECARFMEPYVPVRSHMLRRVKTVGNDSIVYKQPYARYQYFGKLMVSSITGSAYARYGETKVLTNADLVYHGGGLAGAYWDRRMWADKKHTILREIAREAGGEAE